MGRVPRDTFSWELLRRDLGGSFTARARGLLASEFDLLNPGGQKFGRLLLRGLSAAKFQSGDYSAAFETAGRRYRMVADGEEVLTAGLRERSINELEISCDEQIYEARINLFRNLALASYPGDERAVRLSGGLTGRSYEVFLAAEDGCALPVAVFLLWRIVEHRRRAYRMGSPTEGGAM
jgi:hypothetical protein